MITDTDIAVADTQLVPPHSKQSYQMHIVQATDQSINIDMTNTRLERVHFKIDNSQISLRVHSCVFNQAGFSIETEVNQSHRSVRIERCTFQGDTNDTTIKLINTRKVSIATSVFEDLRVSGERGVQAVYCSNSQIEIDDTVFTRISLTGDDSATIRADSCTLTFSHCEFDGNSAATGGVVSTQGSHVTLSNCSITNNSATKDGGALSLTHRSTLLVDKNTVFENNTCGSDGGAITAYFYTNVNIINSYFIGNKASRSSGGAIFLENQCDMTTEDCVFSGNVATSGGGAIMVMDHSGYNDTGTLFTNNTASDIGKL